MIRACRGLCYTMFCKALHRWQRGKGVHGQSFQQSGLSLKFITVRLLFIILDWIQIIRVGSHKSMGLNDFSGFKSGSNPLKLQDPTFLLMVLYTGLGLDSPPVEQPSPTLCLPGTFGLQHPEFPINGPTGQEFWEFSPYSSEDDQAEIKDTLQTENCQMFMTDAARREQESLKKKIQPKLSLTLSSSVSRGNVSTPPRHSSGSLTPPVTPPITPSSSFRSSTPTGSEYDEEEVDYEDSDSDESWTTESAISSEAILSSMCMNGGDEKPFACPVPGCKKRYKNVNGIKYHAKNGHRTQIRVRKPFKCRCGKSYKTAQGLRHHTINFHPPVSAEIIRKMQQ
ncbi:Juxtaposed with another zinc finger protein 1 [Varanus komodoensis]|nr:Juxtaposed with another zinc finger protein 1 [Varanus komodoensis]